LAVVADQAKTLEEHLKISEAAWEKVKTSCQALEPLVKDLPEKTPARELGEDCKARLASHLSVVAAASAFAEETSSFSREKLSTALSLTEEGNTRVLASGASFLRERLGEAQKRQETLQAGIDSSRTTLLLTSVALSIGFIPFNTFLGGTMRVAILALSLGVLSQSVPSLAGDHGSESGATPAAVLEDLKAGNKRFVSGRAKHPNQSVAVRQELTKGQHPKAIILSCSDSRVPPELLLDEGLGDLFVIRSAGHTVDDMGIASMEYAVEHLGSKLIVVLGHSACGAVKATLGTPADKSAGSSNLDALVTQIRANLTSRRETSSSDPLVISPVRANTDATAENLLSRSKILREKKESGEIEIVSAIYRLDGGVVEFWEPTYKRAGSVAH
jgi:carbonic anhydrase